MHTQQRQNTEPHKQREVHLRNEFDFWKVFVEGHPMIFSTKLVWILTTGFREDFKGFVKAISRAPWCIYI